MVRSFLKELGAAFLCGTGLGHGSPLSSWSIDLDPFSVFICPFSQSIMIVTASAWIGIENAYEIS
jgi:hypothetical protein